MLFDGEDAVRTLQPGELKSLSQKGEIEFPRITEKEIQDRSKGDMLSKGLVIIQTGWFLLQCIARRVEHLPITELEIVTLAFATLNFATYGLWWHKPLNVQCPFRVRIKCRRDRGEEGQNEGEEEIRDDEESGYDDKVFKFGMADAITVLGEAPAAIIHATQGAIAIARRAPVAIHKLTGAIYCTIHSAIIRAVDHVSSSGWGIIWRGLQATFEPFLRMLTQGDMETGAKSVPTFYAGELKVGEVYLIFIGGAGITITFGALHCVAWSFQFPSHIEQLSWRIASLIITCFPVFSWLAGALVHLLNLPHRTGVPVPVPQLEASSRLKKAKEMVFIMGTGIYFVGGALYILSRATLLVVPFVSLRSLPPGAYEIVHWTNFIPHI